MCNNERGRKYQKKNPEYARKYREKNKERMNKNSMESYYRHRDEIAKRKREYDKRTGYKHQKRRIANLTDGYIKTVLKRKDWGDPIENPTPEMIQSKREQLLLHRELKQLKMRLKDGIA